MTIYDLQDNAMALYTKYEDVPATAYREFQSYLNSQRENMTLDDYLRASVYNDYMYMLYRKSAI